MKQTLWKHKARDQATIPGRSSSGRFCRPAWKLRKRRKHFLLFSGSKLFSETPVCGSIL